MHPLYSVAQLRAIEHGAAALLPAGALMQRAGEAAAALALDLIGARPGPVLVLAGPGNNGGDALDTAARLAHAGAEVMLVHLAGAAASPDTLRALGRARAGSTRFIDAPPPARDWALVIDGLFGIGLARPLEGAARAVVLGLEGLACPVLALDIPSGLDADTGALVGQAPGQGQAQSQPVAVRATHTITFIGDKPGLHTGAGRDHAGQVTVAPIGIDPALLPPAMAGLNGPALFAQHLVPRRHDSHKGSFGDVAIVGGAAGMAGAPVLAARAALHAGAGRVFVAALEPALAWDSAQPELMFRDGAAFLAKDGGKGATLVLGPGLGDSATALRLLSKALEGDAPLVLDADALNLVAASVALQQRLAERGGPRQAAAPSPSPQQLLTPHPLEAARLLGVTAAVVQGDRLAAAREIAARLQAVVVLKGSGTVIADPSGRVAINPTGNPGLATGGTGDVLAGVCGALLAQGWRAWEAALGAVWLHGAAADRLVEQGVGPVGLTAGELPAAVRSLLNEAIRARAGRESAFAPFAPPA